MLAVALSASSGAPVQKLSIRFEPQERTIGNVTGAVADIAHHLGTALHSTVMSDSDGPRPGDRLATTVLVLVLVLVSVTRFRLLDVPMERDEGEYAYSGSLILEGVAPYEQAYNMKFPGVYYAYAGILALFGYTPRAIHLGLWMVNAATIVLVYALGRRLAGRVAACAAAAVFGALSLDLGALGLWAHATHFVILFSTAGFLVLGVPASPRRWRLLLGGALLGLAIAMKQHAAALLPLALAEVLWRRADQPEIPISARLRRAGLVTAGAALPLAAMVGLLAAQGVLDRFIFWTLVYASSYVSEVPWREIPASFLGGVAQLIARSWQLWALGLVSLLVVVRADLPRRRRAWLGGYVLCSWLAVCPGWYFRPHYFVVLQPAIALLVGAFVASMVARAVGSRRWTAALVVLAAALVGHYVYAERDLFTRSTSELSRLCYPSDAFNESRAVARYVGEQTRPGDVVGIIGSEPHIFFLSRRRSASRYIYTYPLTAAHPFAKQMQRDMMNEILAARPPLIVFARFPGSWAFRPNGDRTILVWAATYLDKCYELDSVVDLTKPEAQSYYWGPARAASSNARAYAILVYRRSRDSSCTVSPDAVTVPDYARTSRQPPG